MEEEETSPQEQQNPHLEEPAEAPQEAKEEKAKKKKKSKKDKDPAATTAAATAAAAAAAAAGGNEGGPLGGPPQGEDDAAAAEGGPPADVRPKKKKTKKKEGGVVIVDNPEDHVQRSGSNKGETIRKSTLLLCDNSAAVALGNLVAIQRKISSRGEADETFEAANLFEDLEEEDPANLAEKVAAAEERLVSLKEELLASDLKSSERFFQQLQEITKEENIVIGEAAEEEVLSLEQTKSQENMSLYTERQKELQAQQQRLLLYEQVVRKKILEELENKEAQLAIRKRQAEKQDRERQDHLVKLLRECECRMEGKMKKRRARLFSVYGLLRRDGEFMATPQTKEEGNDNNPVLDNLDFVPLGKTYRIEWEKAPQPMCMQVDLCRGIKDKLPPGRLVLLVSMWTRLGGKRLHWSGFPTIEERLRSSRGKEEEEDLSGSFLDLSQPLEVGTKPQEHPPFGAACAATKPVIYEGKFTNELLRFDETLELACPSVSDVEPGMCFIFELFLLRGNETPIDKVVGWGVFPMIDSDFRLIEGNFKVPLLRGSVDPYVRRYIEVEETLSKTLDSWLCNLYFRCQPLPQYSKGQVEFELQLEHAGFLLGGQKQQNQQETEQTKKQFISHSAEREKAETLIQQLVSALEACEDVQTEGEAIVSKDGVRAWRHKEPQVEPFSEVNLNNLQEYGYSVDCGTTLSHPQEASRKLRYLKAALLDEFRLSTDPKELCALISGLLCLVLALWICSSFVSLGNWISLRAFDFPVYNIKASFLYVQLEFVQELASLKQLIITSIAGPLTCFLFFVILSLILYLANLMLGRLPFPVYQLFSAAGACTALCPILMPIIEGLKGQKQGFSFLLFNYYLRETNNGTLGVLMSLIIAIVFLTLGFMAYYVYALYVHLHGQVMDIHRRLTGDNSLFKLPNDFEVSSRYLHWCCLTANEYRGPQGQMRKIIMTQQPLGEGEEETDLALNEEERSEEKKEKKKNESKTTELQILNVEPAVGKQTLFRRFLIHPDGKIVEVLAEAEKEEEKKTEKEKNEKK